MTTHDRAVQVANAAMGATLAELRAAQIEIAEDITCWLIAYEAALAAEPAPERPPLTTKEAARALRCSRDKVCELVHRGVLQRAPSFGRAMLITADSIDAARAARTENA